MTRAEAQAANTRRAYESDFAHFTDWCRMVGIQPLPATPEAVFRYLMDLVADDNAAGYAVSTVERRLAAISSVHESHGHASPPARHAQVRQLMGAIRRTYGRPQNARDPLTSAQLGALIARLDLLTLSGLRDRAVLLVGFASALRRSELAALTVEQLTADGDGYAVSVPGRRSFVIAAMPQSALCPMSAVDEWLAAAAIAAGPVFRKVTRYQTVVPGPLTPAAVALIVKRAARAADISPDRLAAQSLRAGSPPASTGRSSRPKPALVDAGA